MMPPQRTGPVAWTTLELTKFFPISGPPTCAIILCPRSSFWSVFTWLSGHSLHVTSQTDLPGSSNLISGPLLLFLHGLIVIVVARILFDSCLLSLSPEDHKPMKDKDHCWVVSSRSLT